MPRVESGANALLAIGCCLEIKRWADCLDWRAGRGPAAWPKNGTHPPAHFGQTNSRREWQIRRAQNDDRMNWI